MNKIECIGCYNNFYNSNNNLGIKECWLLKTAKIKTRHGIASSSPMNIRAHYWRERIPNCYQMAGVVFLDQIPSYAR